jgi:hypothetical protein
LEGVDNPNARQPTTNWLVLKRLSVAGFEAPGDSLLKHQTNKAPLDRPDN